MKTLLIKVQIQFDQPEDENSIEYAVATIGLINERLQIEFSDISPHIYSTHIDSSDIDITEINRSAPL